ncbi:MAG: septum formation initiator family protein [Lachnospiraceae bacterium]|nr:septum formation initiator family protein [Lachnospiraceae bacterium]
MASGAYRQRRDHRLGMLFAVTVVIILTAIVTVKGLELNTKLREQRAREADLTQRIERQIERSAEISAYEKYTKTRKFIEEVAKEKLGLVYEGEIIFRNEH